MEAADKRSKSARNVVLAYLDVRAKEFDPDQLQKGIKVEEEHKDVYDKAREWLAEEGKKMPISEEHFYEMIAKAHLRELPDYYDRLEKMEEGRHKDAMEFTGIEPLLHPGKKLNDREIARALRLSISAEQDAIHLYELMADCIEDADIKKMVQDIANEEKVHVGEFLRLLHYIDKEDKSFLEEGKKEVQEEIKKKS